MENVLCEQIKNGIRAKVFSVINTLNTVIIGKQEQTELLVAAILSGGHVLLEDVPGTGKTTLASALSRVTGLEFSRVQMTPDVTASDITGYNVYNRQKEVFEFRQGAVMCNILLADEINRASPKTQSSLLEAMEEGRVTVDGTVYSLPGPFCVIATQNPSGFVGTYPLPESQLDRFSVRISLGYPEFEDEAGIVARHLKQCGKETEPERVMSREELLAASELVRQVKADEKIIKYAVSLVSATRNRKEFSMGAGTRASIALVSVAQAYAFIKGRDYIIPEDIAKLYIPVTSHRLKAENTRLYTDSAVKDILNGILKTVEVPFLK